MPVEVLTFEKAVAIGKMVCPPDWELGKVEDVPSVEQISKELGIHLSTVKRWIAESVFVDWMPQKAIITDNFCQSDGEPMEVLAFYLQSRLSQTWLRSSELD